MTASSRSSEFSCKNESARGPVIRVGFAFVLALLALIGCRERASAPSGSPSAPSHSALAAPAPLGTAAGGGPQRLPEDPVKGAQATAQWEAHLAKEERMRKLRYDRRKIEDHRTILAILREARDNYDRAKTLERVSASQNGFTATATSARRRIEKLDPWGVNSNLLEDYKFLLGVLSSSYPAAVKTSLAGDPSPLEVVRSDLDRRTQGMLDWLAKAAVTEDE